jgi:hypothetical protein
VGSLFVAQFQIGTLAFKAFRNVVGSQSTWALKASGQLVVFFVAVVVMVTIGV